MNKNKIINLIESHGIISSMMTKHQMFGVIYYLDKILNTNLEGDIVELGCNIGTTSLYIRTIMDIYNSKKEFHVYDSWEGLPEKLPEDTDMTNKYNIYFQKGSCTTSKYKFINVFKTIGLTMPTIHSGWFKEISDHKYPEKICFAFLDGDFYSSITDSLNKIYHKMVKGGIIIIDDCGNGFLPGCKKAVEDFLEDKEENLELTGYPNKQYEFGEMLCGGIIIKL